VSGKAGFCRSWGELWGLAVETAVGGSVLIGGGGLAGSGGAGGRGEKLQRRVGGG